jgi:hypothetical protein
MIRPVYHVKRWTALALRRIELGLYRLRFATGRAAARIGESSKDSWNSSVNTQLDIAHWLVMRGWMEFETYCDLCDELAIKGVEINREVF